MTRFIALLCVIFTLWSFSAKPSKADPITATLVAIGVSATTAAAITSAIISFALTAAASMLSKALQKKPVPPGIKLERTATGGAVGRRAIIGYYATAGSEVCPPMSHGADGKTPNAYLTKVIAVSDVPVDSITAVMVNGEFVPLGAVSEYGLALGGKYAGLAWVRFHDGRQTAADDMLVSKYSNYIRPWGPDRIGTGVAYAIFTFKLDTDVFKGEPECKVELIGMRLYDLRKDSSIGGSGSQRWDDPTTWGPTLNPAVMIYNLLRGIDVGDDRRYGGEAVAEDLPVSNWVAAMNVCDELVPLDGNYGSEPRYRAGYEIDLLEDEPASVIEELLKACSGSIVELGGVYKIRCGPPSLPVMFVTDEDFIITSDQDFNPFPDIGASHNSINCVFPHPGTGWNTHEAPPFTVAAYVEQDDGIDLPASLQMPSCPFPWQVQRNMRAWLQDDRRWRQHSARFGHYAWALEPLDVVSWTSARNGYAGKLFEVDAADENLMTLGKRVQLREIDPSDYSWSPEMQLPDPVTPGQWELPVQQQVPGWNVLPSSVKDGDGEDRRPALLCMWTVDAAEDATALKIQVRLAGTTTLITDATIGNFADGFTLLSEGILPSTSYEARAEYLVDRPTAWSAWVSVTTGDIKLGGKDFDPNVIVEIPELKPIFDGLKEIPNIRQGVWESAMNLVNEVVGRREIDRVGREGSLTRDDQISKDLVTTRETLSVANAEAVAAIETERNARITAVSAETQARTLQYSALNNSLAIVDQRSQTTATDLSAETLVRQQQVSQLGNNLAVVDQRSQTLVTDVSSLSQTTTTLLADYGSFKSTAQQQLTTLSNASGAQATLISTIDARSANNATNITAAQQAISTEAYTRGQADLSLQSDYNGKLASVNQQLTTISSDQQQLATLVQQVQTTANGASSSASIALSAVNGQSAYVAFQTNVNGQLSGFKLNGLTREAAFLADYFKVVNDGGDGLDFDGPAGRMKITRGSRKVLLQAQGVLLWAGNASVADDNVTFDNGTLGFDDQGNAWFGGKTSSGFFDSGTPSATELNTPVGQWTTIASFDRIMETAGYMMVRISLDVRPQGSPGGNDDFNVNYRLVCMNTDGSQVTVIGSNFGNFPANTWTPVSLGQGLLFENNVNIATRGLKRLALQVNPDGVNISSALARNGRFRGLYGA